MGKLFTLSMSFRPTNRFLLLNATQFTLGNEPAFPPYSTQDTAFGNFLAKALQKLVLRFARPQGNICHATHLLSWPHIGQKTQKNPAAVRAQPRLSSMG